MLMNKQAKQNIIKSKENTKKEKEKHHLVWILGGKLNEVVDEVPCNSLEQKQRMRIIISNVWWI